MSSSNNPVNTDAFQKMLQQLRKSFLEDMPERLDSLENLLLDMEKIGADSEAFNELCRIVHSLKGNGGSFGLHIITTICHQMEDLLTTTEGGTKYTPALIAISLNYVDLLRITLKQILAGNTSFPQIEERLGEMGKQIAQRNFTILLVDNSKLSTQIYLQALAELPVRPVVMTDGLQALTRVLTEPFDLLITTNEIPVLSGVALIGALKLSSANNRSIKTILITSNNKIVSHLNRATDANYIIVKDARLAQNMDEIVRRALSITESA